MTLRPRRASDDPAVARIIREVAQGWIASERAVRHRRVTMPERARRADWVWEADGEAVGWGSASLELDRERQDVADVDVMVRPSWRGRGIGGALYEAGEAHALELGAGRLLTSVEDEPSACRFAERRGFRRTMTKRLSSVDPRDVDAAALASLSAAKEAEGFSPAPFTAFRECPELVHAVDAEASLDEPADEPITSLPLDDWLTRHWNHPDLSHEGSFAVVHDGRPVAITMLIVDVEGGRALNGFTGTLRAYRGRGLARLAKLASIAWAAEHGIVSIATDNDETNAPMLAVNVSLGYRPYAAWFSYVKDVG
jgi:GNAT superfamily N-acetyltransferase